MNNEWIAAGAGGILLLVYVVLFNRLVAAHHKVKQAWSGIDVQFKRRHDLIPKLVDTVRAYADYEQQVLQQTVAARSEAIRRRESGVGAQGEAEGTLSGALHRLFAVAEAYPDLKANQNFMQLQGEISETEDQIAAARRIYNANVNELNVQVNSFPTNLVARLHRFREAVLFEIDSRQRGE